MGRTVDATRTRSDIRVMFQKWGVDQYTILRDQEEYKSGAIKRGDGVTVSYLRRGVWQRVYCDHSDFGDNIRSIYTFVDRIRIAEKVGIAYQGLSSTKDLVQTDQTGKTTGEQEDLEDAYDVLGVLPTDTEEVFKKVYGIKAMSYHPDKGGNEDDFKRLQRAYEIICKARGIAK